MRRESIAGIVRRAQRDKRALVALAFGLAALSACALPGAQRGEPAATYLLEWPEDWPGTPARAKHPCVTLIVAVPRSAPGFGTPAMAYVRQRYRLDYFAMHRWIDTPAQMLQPLFVRALTRSGLFRDVVSAPSPVAGDLELHSEVLHLQQVFSGDASEVQFALRVELFDLAQRRLLADHTLSATQPAASNTPYGGVVAANRAVAELLVQLVGLVADKLEAESSLCTRQAAPPS